MNWKKTRQIWPNLSRVSFPISITFFFFKQNFKEMPKIGNHRKPASWWPNVWKLDIKTNYA